MIRVKNALNKDDTWVEVTSVVPPSSESFPYWTLYLAKPSEEGYKQCLWLRRDEVPSLLMQDDQSEEVEEHGKIQPKVPNLWREYRDITAGADEPDDMPSL